MSHVPYTGTIDNLMYAMVCTRPCIAHVVGVLSLYISKLGKEHWEATNMVFNFCMGLMIIDYATRKIRMERALDIHGFVDADYSEWK